MEFLPCHRKGMYPFKGFHTAMGTLTFFSGATDDPLPYDVSLEGVKNIIISKECFGLESLVTDFCFPGLESIQVEEDNPVYASFKENNVLMRRDGNLILGCKKSIIPDSCIVIGHRAFYNIPGMDTLFVPKSVQTIYEDSFDSLPDIKNVIVDKDNPCYESPYGSNGIIEKKTRCLIYAIANTIIPEGVTMIDPNCYHNVKGLKELNLPKSVQIIGRGAYSGCDGLKDIRIPENVKRIDRYAFSRCENLSKVYFPSSTAYIEPYSFSGCPRLYHITFQMKNPNYSPKSDIAGIFLTKKKILYVGTRRSKLNRNIKKIHDCAFDGTHGLRELLIPSSVSQIEFKQENIHSESLSRIDVNPNNETYDSRGECNCILRKKTDTLVLGCRTSFVPMGTREIGSMSFMHVKGMKRFVIPKGVKIISPYAFYDCDIEEIEIQEGVEIISDHAFKNTNHLKKVILPSSLTMISEGAFENSSIEEIDLPQVKIIGRYAFKNCSQLKNIILHDGLIAIFEGAFEDCVSLARLNLPKTVERIYPYILNGCSLLSSFELPRDCETVFFPLFKKGNNLERITVHPKNRYFDSGEDDNCIYDFRTGVLYLGCRNTSFNKEIRFIAEMAFAGTMGLKELQIPEGIEEIKEEAFADCLDLEKLSLPSSLASVSDTFTDRCDKLQSLFLSCLESDVPSFYRKKNPKVKLSFEKGEKR